MCVGVGKGVCRDQEGSVGGCWKGGCMGTRGPPITVNI